MARLFLSLVFILWSVFSFAQIREVPKEVKDNFETQYPNAEKVEFSDNLVNVHVSFEISGEKMTAVYNNKGVWKLTEKVWSFDQLSEEVKDGFQKSKYADWKVVDASIVYQPGGTERYRIKVQKNDIQKKNIYFNKTGRLMDDDITL